MGTFLSLPVYLQHIYTCKAPYATRTVGSKITENRWFNHWSPESQWICHWFQNHQFSVIVTDHWYSVISIFQPLIFKFTNFFCKTYIASWGNKILLMGYYMGCNYMLVGILLLITPGSWAWPLYISKMCYCNKKTCHVTWCGHLYCILQINKIQLSSHVG